MVESVTVSTDRIAKESVRILSLVIQVRLYRIIILRKSKKLEYKYYLILVFIYIYAYMFQCY